MPKISISLHIEVRMSTLSNTQNSALCFEEGEFTILTISVNHLLIIYVCVIEITFFPCVLFYINLKCFEKN